MLSSSLEGIHTWIFHICEKNPAFWWVFLFVNEKHTKFYTHLEDPGMFHMQNIRYSPRKLMAGT